MIERNDESCHKDDDDAFEGKHLKCCRGEICNRIIGTNRHQAPCLKVQRVCYNACPLKGFGVKSYRNKNGQVYYPSIKDS